MSHTFTQTRLAVNRVRAALRVADEDTKYKFAFWCIGIAVMAVAVVLQFGWSGALFCAGIVFWAAGTAD